MKIVITLFVLSLVVGLIGPYFVNDVNAVVVVQLSQLWFSKSPPRSFSFSVPVVLRGIGILLALLAIIRFILVRGSRV